MASPGQLVKVTAEVLGIPEPTVVLADRFLSEAGLRSKSGRGRGAAKVTAEDAANLLIALAGSPYPKDAVQNVENYAGLPLKDLRSGHERADTWKLESFPVRHLQALPPNHTFRDVLVALIVAAGDGGIGDAFEAVPPLKIQEYTIPQSPYLDISLYGPVPEARIRFSGFGSSEEAFYLDVPATLEGIRNWSDKYPGDLRRTSTFSWGTIGTIGELLARVA